MRHGTTCGQKALAIVLVCSGLAACTFVPVSDTSQYYSSLLRSLQVDEPAGECPPYDPDAYAYSSSLEYHLVLYYGGVYDPYNDRWYRSLDSLRSLDIEHIVARKEAHISGMCFEPDSIKAVFASDSLNLALALASTNREKSDKDPAEWLPEFNQCWFTARVIEVRSAFGLTIDPDELNTLEGLIRQCDEFVLESAHERPDNPLHDESKGCPATPYPSCAALRADYPHGVYRTHCAYNPALDQDRNGWICL